MRKGTSTVPRLAGPTAVFVSILWAAGAIAHAADWPQFRGPTGQGHALDAAVPLEWSETENVTWKSAGHGPRLVIAGHRRRPDLADDGRDRPL